jgi:hypothetical protein
MLKEKNITIGCDIPEKIYILPVLETDYEIIEINKQLLKKYLGSGIEHVQDVYSYSNSRGETLDIINGKVISYTLRGKSSGKLDEKADMNKQINDFLAQKNIDASDFKESGRYISDNSAEIIYNQFSGDYSIDNSYMKFYFDKSGIYKFEMQKINSFIETKSKVRSIPAAEALLRLLTYDDVRGKEIKNIKMTYYNIEDDNWQNITRINSDPTWKVIFTDGTEKHLPSYD